MASVRVVFPHPPWPRRTTFRMSEEEYSFVAAMGTSFVASRRMASVDRPGTGPRAGGEV
jgi:hypothetical protein